MLLAIALLATVGECQPNATAKLSPIYLTNSMIFSANMGYCAFEIYSLTDTDVEITELKISLETVVDEPESVKQKKKKKRVELVIESVGGNSANAYASGSVELPCETDGVFRVIKASGKVEGKLVDLTSRIASFDPPRMKLLPPVEGKELAVAQKQLKR
jgi:hypothetical protein